MRIDAHTRFVGILGWPVAHSLSPVMHNAAFSSRGLNWIYLPLPVKEKQGEIGRAIKGLSAMGFVGANITLPHKEAVLVEVDRLTDAAARIGAVNTIQIAEDGEISGDNTDADGFLSNLEEHQIDVRGKDALVVGAGGAARAIVYALTTAAARSIRILARNVDGAAQIARDIGANCRATDIVSGPWSERPVSALKTAELIVNCTPVGMEGFPTSIWPGVDQSFAFQRGQVFCDLVYSPLEPPLVKSAKQCGAEVVSGPGMLIHQGAKSFEIWTGERAPVDVMRQAAMAFLTGAL
jgi:shikimate dehydrogenase